MKIKISDRWLREYLKTDLRAPKIGELLSLCGPSVEYVDKVGDDYIYDIEVTTNRPDMMSVVGIAREAYAILKSFGYKVSFRPPLIKPLKNLKEELKLEVRIKDPSLCPRFTAIILDNIKVTKSPSWLAERLEKSGLRSLNNVVDISNYVMLELGQPMHIFDYDKIKDQVMTLRQARKGEEIITIDQVKRILPQGAIVIEDKERLVDLCGIMGGANSAVSLQTQRIIVFVQVYHPHLIRKACQALGFWTEAATRFEKGIDQAGVLPALWRAVELLEKLAGGKVKSELIDLNFLARQTKKVKVKLSKINDLVGVEIPASKAKEYLDSLGFRAEVKGDYLEAEVPSWRLEDINIPEDLIEEIARLYGYNNLPSLLPPHQILEQKTDPQFLWEKKAKELLKHLGFIETYNWSLVSQKLLTKFQLNPQECLKVANPLSSDLEYLRISLIPSLLENLAENQAYFERMKIFEMANIYLKTKEGHLPQESLHLAGAWFDQATKEALLFYQAKGVLESLFEELAIKGKIKWQRVKKPNFSEGQTAQLVINNQPVGFLGILEERVASLFDLRKKPVVFDLDFSCLINHVHPFPSYQPLPKYPTVKLDLAIVVDEGIPYQDLEEEIKKAGLPWLSHVELFDVYKSPRLGLGKKSLAFSLTYQAKDHTLSLEEAKSIHQKIIKALEKKFQAVLRE